jgi:hypothetical protein
LCFHLQWKFQHSLTIPSIPGFTLELFICFVTSDDMAQLYCRQGFTESDSQTTKLASTTTLECWKPPWKMVIRRNWISNRVRCFDWFTSVTLNFSIYAPSKPWSTLQCSWGFVNVMTNFINLIANWIPERTVEFWFHIFCLQIV